MIGLRRVFIVHIIFVLFLAASGPALSQPPGGGGDQPQMSQNNQTGQQAAQGGVQMQQGPAGQQSFGQRVGQGQQSGQMQNMIIQRLKQLMGATDEEWTVLGPKVLTVYTLVSSQTRGMQMRSLMGDFNQGRGGMSNQTASDTSDKTIEELQTLLASENTTTTQLRNKISEVRKAKEESIQKLAKAQKELRELLSLKQEATLISVGLLE